MLYLRIKKLYLPAYYSLIFLKYCLLLQSLTCVLRKKPHLDSRHTFHKNYEGPEYIQNEKFTAINTNPLTWRTDNTYAPEKLNKGGILFKFNKVIPGVVDAQVHGNMLWASKPDFFGKIFLKKENYHIADINLFYVNISEDVKRRIGLFWKQ